MAKIHVYKNSDPDLFRPGLYEHYKGGQYVALHLVEHHDTGEFYVVYVSCEHGTLHLQEWARPGKSSWCDQVTVNGPTDGESLPIQVPRFRYVRPTTP